MDSVTKNKPVKQPQVDWLGRPIRAHVQAPDVKLPRPTTNRRK